MKRQVLIAVSFFACVSVLTGHLPAKAQEKSTLEVGGYIKLQAGVFTPLASDGFSAQKNKAFYQDALGNFTTTPCDPIMEPTKPCIPTNHGMEAGSLSMFRSTLLLEGDWRPHENVSVHAIIRGVLSLQLEVDGWGSIARPFNSSAGTRKERLEENAQWSYQDNYNEFDVRELYVDVDATDWLSFRLGKQLVTWGESGAYRLLDMVNPSDESWHFGPLESYEDTRIPLWIVKSMIDFPSINHNLEIIWLPGIDRPRDMVTLPLTNVGAWGVPRSNTPMPFTVDEFIYNYPKNSIEDTMRIGLRWQGDLGERMTYSLVYYYTHQLTPPIPISHDWNIIATGLDPNRMKNIVLGFPRQHIAGFSLNYTFENPIATGIKLEASIEPDRTYPQIVLTKYKHEDPTVPGRYIFDNPKMFTATYGITIMRPTMIRFLHPSQSFLLLAQFVHTILPGLTVEDKNVLVDVPSYDNMKVKTHQMMLVGLISTEYLHGMISPQVIGVFIFPNSGLIAAQVNFRLGESWRMRLQVTDFFGADPYRDAGLFRDRDEVNLSILCQF